jgi:hypothetical protein
LAVRVGDIGDDNLLREFSCHGVESREEEPAEGEREAESEAKEQESRPDYDSMSQAEFEKVRLEEGAKRF